MVLGHGGCGAITATIESIATGKRPPVHIDAIVGALRPIVEPVLRQAGNKVDNAGTADVRAQVRQITDRSDIIRQAVRRNELAVVGARYELENGEVTLLR
jgi:carbonic anhydrase